MTEIRADSDIILKKLRMESAEMIFNTIDSDRNHLRTWLPFVDYTIKTEDTESFIRSINNSTNQKKDLLFEIYFKNKFCGLAGYKEIDRINLKTELGYWLHSDFCGKGIMTRSISAMVSYAFTHLQMNRVEIKVALGNARSSLIPERLGFNPEGIEKAGELLNGSFVDLMVYSMLKAEWQNQNK